jgi:hypothetical protein
MKGTGGPIWRPCWWTMATIEEDGVRADVNVCVCGGVERAEEQRAEAHRVNRRKAAEGTDESKDKGRLLVFVLCVQSKLNRAK